MPLINGDQTNNYLFGTIEKEEIAGLDGDDHLVGFGGTDVLAGGNGNDTLIGGTTSLSQAAINALVLPDTIDSYVASLKDTLTGGAGADRFVISGVVSGANVNDPRLGVVYSVQFNLDEITDFTPGIDKIVLVTSTSSVTLPSTTIVTDTFRKLPDGSLPAEMLRIGNGVPVNANDFLIYDSATGIIYYDSDGTVAGPIPFVRLAGAPALSAADFEIIAANMLTGTDGNDTLTGIATIDRINGQVGNDTLRGGPGNDILSGGNGIDAAIYSGNKADYRIVRSGAFYVLDTQTTNGDEGLDSLSVERLQFLDTSVAYDLTGNAGKVAKILGAVFGSAMVADQRLAGIGLHYIDSGLTYEALMQMAIAARLGANATNRQVVDLLYNNVVGSLPSETVAQSYVQLLETNTHTWGTLGVLAADTALNTININLVGLAETGLSYTEYLV